MKQKTGKLTVITVLLLTVCIAAGAMGLPRLLGESFSIPEAAEPALPGTALWVGMDELPLVISKEKASTDAVNPPQLSEREREKAEKEALRQLLIFARENRIETLYWQVTDEEDSSRLELLCKAADGSPAIWAAVKGDYAPAKKLKYEPAGLALWGDGLTAEELRNKLSGLGESGLPLALRWDAELAGEELTELVQKNNLTRLLPVLPEVAGREYIARSESWQNTGAEVTPVVTALQGGVTGSQLFYNARNGKAAGFVLANYGEISDNTAARGLLLSYADAAQTRPLTAVSLEYAKELHIGYPANNALVYTAQVFIMGTSDPTKPLTMDGKEVERTGEGGCFGVSVSLAYGKNRNGEDSLTLTIRRGSGTGDGTTSTLTSRFPTSDAAVWAGQELTFRCVAPSGSKVTAVIHGQTVTMQQTAATAKNGIAATYKGTYQVPADLPAGELQDWGPVKYTMVWGGKTTSYESAGRLYAAGKNTTPAVLANTENVSLLTDYTDDSTFIATYHRGAKIPMVGCFQYNGTIFYEVAGGYISSDRATVAPTPAEETTIGAVSSVTEGRLTTITLPCGSYPAASAKREGALLTIYLENTALPESTEGIAAPMIKEARWEETEGGVNLLLTLNEESYWGYDLQYTEEGDLLLIVADAKNEVVYDALGQLRNHLAQKLGLIEPGTFDLLWVTEFPLFEYSEEEGRYMAKHHPFTCPMLEDLDMIESDPGHCRARAYDMVMNGCEVGGGSIRINTMELQERMLVALGFTPESAEERFGFLLEAFRYGAPPHGGMAFGLDRLVMLLLGKESIKDVIAFPKVQNASELMSGCPAEVEDKSLAELAIKVDLPQE